MVQSIGPSYKRVADDLRSQIASGDLKVGDSIPSTPKLQDLYGASNTVVRHAVSVLRDEGLVMGQPGKAVYVIATPQTLAAEVISVDALTARFDELAAEVRGLAERVTGELADELAELHTKFGVLQTHLIDLYGRLGHPYPHDAPPQRGRETGT